MPPRKSAVFAAVLLALAACADQETAAPALPRTVSPNLLTVDEAEIFGDVYDDSVEITDSIYFVMLQPERRTFNTIKAKGYTDYDSIMWVNPEKYAGGWMWSWYEIQSHQAGCPGLSDEQHARTRGGQPETDHEVHCVTAGNYLLSLWHGSPEAAGSYKVRELEVQHLQVHTSARARNTENGNSEDMIEAPADGGDMDISTYDYTDLIVPLDIGSGAAAMYSATP